MGPLLEYNNTNEKAKEFLACVNNVFPQRTSYYREVKLLMDGRIICINYLIKEIKIYKLINNYFILDLQFSRENEDRGPTTLCEIEENIILFGDYMKLDLIDIRNNTVILLQRIKFKYQSFIKNVIKLSDGLIAMNNSTDIVFFKYDKNNKKIEKVGEIATKSYIHRIWEVNNGFILAAQSHYIYI